MQAMRSVNPLWKLAAASFVGLVCLCLLLPGSPLLSGWHSPDQSITLYCAASLRLPVEEIAQRYRNEFGVEVRVNYGGSNTLLSQIEVSRQGDLYLAADQWYLEMAREKGLVEQEFSIARMKPVVVVSQKCPKQVERLTDLLDLRLALASPDQAAIGRETRRLLLDAGTWGDFESHATVFKPTVSDVANDVQLSVVDAGIVWDAVARQTGGVEIVELQELELGVGRVAVGVLSGSEDPEEALRFARFLSGGGLQVFSQMGYDCDSSETADLKNQSPASEE